MVISTVRLTPELVQVRLSVAEKIGAVHGDLDVPRSAIRAADVVADGLAAAKGLRAPGLALPGRIKLGTWRSRRTRRFVAVRRGQPALRLALQGQRYDIILVSTPDADALAADLRAS